MRSDGYTLNPWFSIWTQPRATMQQVVEDNPRRFVIILPSIVWLLALLEYAVMGILGDKWPIIFLIAIIAIPIVAMIWLRVSATLIQWSGVLIGGYGTRQNIRAALAWSGVPTIWFQTFKIFLILSLGSEIFGPGVWENSSPFFMLGASFVLAVIGIWMMVIVLKCLGQVQGFSAWRALLNVILSGILLIALIAVAVIFFQATGLVPS